MLVQGVAAPFVYLVESGVLVSELCTLDGSRATVSLLRAGDVFGEAALAGAGSNLLSTVGGPGVRALTASRLLALDPGEVDRALDADPAARRWFTNGLLDRLARTERRLGRTLALPLAGRVLMVIEELSGDGDLAGVALTQEEVGRMVGASRESVNRAMSRLVRERRLVQRGGRYSVAGRSFGAEA